MILLVDTNRNVFHTEDFFSSDLRAESNFYSVKLLRVNFSPLVFLNTEF